MHRYLQFWLDDDGSQSDLTTLRALFSQLVQSAHPPLQAVAKHCHQHCEPLWPLCSSQKETNRVGPTHTAVKNLRLGIVCDVSPSMCALLPTLRAVQQSYHDLEVVLVYLDEHSGDIRITQFLYMDEEQGGTQPNVFTVRGGDDMWTARDAVSKLLLDIIVYSGGCDYDSKHPEMNLGHYLLAHARLARIQMMVMPIIEGSTGTFE